MMRTPLSKAQRIAARFIPAGSTEQRYPQFDAVVYLRDDIYAVGYVGSAMRPAFNYRFRSEAARTAHLEQWVKGLDARLSMLVARRVEAALSAHLFQVGEVLYSTWGYEQTNVEFYQVIRVVSDKSIEVRELAQTRTETLYMQGTAMPVLDRFLADSAPLVRRTKGEGIRIDSHIGAYRWDGRPINYSSYA